ncbi:hypothetical protein MIDIC_460026 [Alphaproteobacteria bacterium]
MPAFLCALGLMTTEDSKNKGKYHINPGLIDKDLVGEHIAKQEEQSKTYSIHTLLLFLKSFVFRFFNYSKEKVETHEKRKRFRAGFYNSNKIKHKVTRIIPPTNKKF